MFSDWIDGGFATVVDVGQQVWPFTLGWPSVGDFNGDGNPDVVLNEFVTSAQRLTVAFGLPDGGFLPPVSDPSWPTCEFSTSPARYNDDTFDDLVCETSNAGYSVLLGEPDGGFAQGQAFAGWRMGAGRLQPRADFNHDGVDELVMIVPTSPASSEVGTLLDDGGVAWEVDGPFAFTDGGRFVDGWELGGSGVFSETVPLSIALVTPQGGGLMRIYGSMDGGLQVVSEFEFPLDLTPVQLIDVNGDGVLDAFGSRGDGYWPSYNSNPAWVDGRCFSSPSP